MWHQILKFESFHSLIKFSISGNWAFKNVNLLNFSFSDAHATNVSKLVQTTQWHTYKFCSEWHNVLHFPSTCPFLIFREISHWYPHYPLSSPASVYWTRPVISPTIGNIWPGHMLFPPQTTKLTITWSEEMVWDSERERYLVIKQSFMSNQYPLSNI